MKVVLNSLAVGQIMARKNMSQNRLAQRLGTSSGYISQLMTGKRYPSPQMRKKLLKVLQVDEFDELFILQDG